MDINWTKVPIGTNVYVRNETDQVWHLRKLAVYVEDISLPFGCFGNLSNNGNIVWWRYAKLAEGD